MSRLRRRHTLRRPRPTSRGWWIFLVAAVVLAGAGFAARADLLLIGLFCAILPVSALLVVTFDRPHLDVTRSVTPDLITLGDEAQVSLTVENRAVRPTGELSWREAVPEGLLAADEGEMPGLAPHRSPGGRDVVRLRHTVVAERRGVYPIGPFVVEGTDPFGLAQSEHAAGGTGRLIVTPRVRDLSGAGSTRSGEGTTSRLLQSSNPSVDELIARQYHPGDPLRRVHWPATARRGELMVRQEERSSSPEAWLVIDTAGSDPEVFELVVETAASVGVHLLGGGYSISVLETGPARMAGTHGTGRSGTLGSTVPTFDPHAGDRAFLTELAGLEDGSDRTDYAPFLTAALRNSGQRTPVVLVLCDSGVEEFTALSALPSLARPAVALLAGRSRQSEQRFAEAGFSCAALADPEDIADAWDQALAAPKAEQHG